MSFVILTFPSVIKNLKKKNDLTFRHDWKSTDRRVAEKVISVVRGDIRQTIPLAGTGAEDKKFDIVTAILCIACASEDKTAYRQNVLNIRYLYINKAFVLDAIL